MEAAALSSHINGIVNENVVIVNKCEDQPNKNGYHQNGYINGVCKKDYKNLGNGCELSAINGLTNGHSKGINK